MITITPVQTLNAVVTVPGSKSLTQRALIAAALADGSSRLHGPLASEDTSFTIQALRAMGIDCDDSDPACWLVHGRNGRIMEPGADIFLGNNGTATRFLTSVAALGHGRFRITGNERMAQRPILPLIEALRGWRVDIVSDEGTGCPPLTLFSRGLAGGHTVLPEGRSSQYLSSLLLVAPYAVSPATLEVRGEILSQPYIAMTLSVMSDFGIRVEAAPDFSAFRIPQGRYRREHIPLRGMPQAPPTSGLLRPSPAAG